MDKKSEFKRFLKDNPKLINYIKSHDNGVQKLYEVYDVYGEDEKVWEEYLSDRTINLQSITNAVKNIDMESIKSHINTAQKALGVVQELTGKATSKISNIVKPTSSRPITKFFED